MLDPSVEELKILMYLKKTLLGGGFSKVAGLEFIPAI